MEDRKDRLIRELSDSVEFLLAERSGLQDHVRDLETQLELAVLLAKNAQAAVLALTPTGRAS